MISQVVEITMALLYLIFDVCFRALLLLAVIDN